MNPTIPGIMAALALAGTVHASNTATTQPTTQTSVQDIQREIDRICAIPAVRAKISPAEVCEVPTDNGKTLMVSSGLALVALIAGVSSVYTFRRRKVEGVRKSAIKILELPLGKPLERRMNMVDHILHEHNVGGGVEWITDHKGAMKKMEAPNGTIDIRLDPDSSMTVIHERNGATKKSNIPINRAGSLPPESSNPLKAFERFLESEEFLHRSDPYEPVETKNQSTDPNTIIATSDGGKSRMDDYVCSHRDDTGTTIIVLDGVSGGSDDTPKFVEAIADKLKTMSVQVLMDNQGIIRQGLVGIGDTATTMGRAHITGNVLTIEKLGDIGVVVASRDGTIKYSNIGGGYIPDSWFGSDILVTQQEKGDIQETIKTNCNSVVDLRKAVTQNDVMRMIQHYTPQFGSHTDCIDPVISHQMSLESGDRVIMATDGVWDNMSIGSVVKVILNNSINPTLEVMAQLKVLQECGQGEWGPYKADNVGVAVYKHL